MTAFYFAFIDELLDGINTTIIYIIQHDMVTMLVIRTVLIGRLNVHASL